MYVLILAECLNQILIPRHMCQKPQFNLRIIGIHKQIPRHRVKHLPNQSSQFNADRNILQIRLRTAQSSCGSNGLIEGRVNLTGLIHIVH